jgi:hypothetical protein
LISIEVKAGAVRTFDIRKSRIYIGANGIFSSTNIKEEASNLPITTTSQDYIGLGGLIGYRRFFNPNFSLSLEAEPHGCQSISKSLLPNPYKTKSGINLQVLVSYHFKELRKSCACGKPGS